MSCRINRQPKYLLCVKVSSLCRTFLSLFGWDLRLGVPNIDRVIWLACQTYLFVSKILKHQLWKFLLKAQGTGFVVLKFYSFKVKNKDKEVCFDSIKGICWFICSLWFGWNVWSSVFFCVAIYVVNILDILCLYEMVVLMSYFQAWFMENNCAFVKIFFFISVFPSCLKFPSQEKGSMFFRAVGCFKMFTDGHR